MKKHRIELKSKILYPGILLVVLYFIIQYPEFKVLYYLAIYIFLLWVVQLYFLSTKNNWKTKNLNMETIVNVWDNNHGTITILSKINLIIEDIDLLVSSDNDPNDWINWFFEDYNRGFYLKKEKITIKMNIIANIPTPIPFSSTTLKEFNLENMKKYIEDVSRNPDFTFEADKEIFKRSFLDPKWNLDIYLKWKMIASHLIQIQDQEMISYIKSL